MLPMSPEQRLAQNKISGLRIAFGEGIWATMEDGSEGYVFNGPHGFTWENEPHAKELGVTMEALVDCIDQIEEQMGGPKSVRDAFGLFGHAGHAYLGLTVQSRVDDRLILNYTPTSVEGSPVEAYFEWYLKQENSVGSDGEDMETAFARLAGINMEQQPVADMMPSFEEASHLIPATPALYERREAFLERLFRFEKTLAKGFRLDEEVVLRKEWKAISEAANLEIAPNSDDMDEAMNDKSNIDEDKDGEGSRGGKVIGHTRSGKPIYAASGSKEHKSFSKDDHEDAMHAHHSAIQRKSDEHHRQSNGDGTFSKKHAANKERLRKEIVKHREHAAKHGDKAFPELKSHSPDQKDFDRMDRKNDPQKRSKASGRGGK